MQSTRARTVALCYARKSDVRVGADLVSIDIQRAAIAAECSWRGWTPEWYEDADGHRSGRREDGRPQFLKLKTRLGDSDVAAVVGYRLDRISRIALAGEGDHLERYARAVGAVVSVRMRPPAERAFGVIRAAMPLLPKVGAGDNVGMIPRVVRLSLVYGQEMHPAV